ncbi:MAG TPA: GntR family transcriptional regulator [Verrucomicrobiae bacterium]|jgi:LacI family transcriptional regulator
MAQDSKHHLIYQALASDIGNGKYRETGKLPSEAQLVARFKVSRPTVIRALRDLQADGLVTRRVGAGTFLNRSSPQPLPSQPLPVQSLELGLLVPGVRRAGEIFEVIAGELARLARAAGYMFWWTGGSSEDLDAVATLRNAEKICDQFIQRKVAGVFFASFEHMAQCDSTNFRLVNRLREAGITVTLLDRDMSSFPLRTDLDLVGIDNFQGGYILAKHLIKLGCRRIGFVAVPFSAPTIKFRLAGAREAILEAGMELPHNFFQVGNPEDPKFVRMVAAGRMKDAIICGNDYTAAVLIRSLHKIGVSVPKGLRVVGFDDVHYATLVSPPLTTMHQPCREIATLAFKSMLSRIADPTTTPRTVMLTPSLVVRESCGAYLSRPNNQEPVKKKRA